MSDIAIAQEVWDHRLTASAPTKAAWLWQGFIAPANTTLFTSHGKLGKTTLPSMLLSRRQQGGTLEGFAVKPGRTVVILEPAAILQPRQTERILRSFFAQYQLPVLRQKCPHFRAWLERLESLVQAP